ncbi:MAG: ParB/RepB/Spo0J family partition protein [Spirochaetaceae bacterium]|jgi:ParB/RepB/Spo0J family partition protein|nr:ParB/RepB/Spo0J family partition protein [Spirochaetaceae bacterium]
MKEEKIGLAGLRFSSNRAYGGEGDIKILAEDIRRNGLINPITVKAIQEEADAGQTITVYEVIAGRRRLQAVTLLGWKDIPCRVLEGDETKYAEDITLSENVNRLTMHPLDEAELYRRLLEAGESIGNIAKRQDRTVSGIWQRIQLLDLSAGIKAMFREGRLDLQSAAMLKSLDEKEQAEFVKANQKYVGFINSMTVANFVHGLHNDTIYKFLGKGCEKCKTRTFFTEKSLFPETNVNRDFCLDHGCYVRKWTELLEARVKSLKGEHKSHAAATLIIEDYTVNLKKVFDKGVTLDGTEYKIVAHDWSSLVDSGGAGREPCFLISANADKLHAKPAYWKTAKREPTDLKAFSAELKLLELPKDEDAAVREALKTKRINHSGFLEKVRKEILSRLITLRATDKAFSRGDAELLLKNAFGYPSVKIKKIFTLFTGKEYAGSVKEVLALGDSAVLALLYSLTLSEYDIPPAFDSKKMPEVFEWAGLNLGDTKELYQEVIRDLLLKPKAKKAAPAAKKPAKAKK